MRRWLKTLENDHLYLINFMVQIKYNRFNSEQTVTSFKIFNDVAVYILLDQINKI